IYLFVYNSSIPCCWFSVITQGIPTFIRVCIKLVELRGKVFYRAQIFITGNTFPEEICIKPILSSCPLDGVVLDPFLGRGTTMKVARDLGRNSIGIEIQPDYLPIIKKYLEIDQQRFGVTHEIVEKR
ncbi:MAG: DNA methyltransferase, partial [Methanocellales archaeon]|nr:DNA methyltransferase [Methanocellales archaeon]